MENIHQILNYELFVWELEKNTGHEKEPPENKRGKQTFFFYQGPYSNLIHSEIQNKNVSK